jgi:DNA-binding winged helix-turn-helix (wHTH) protein/TolB-like protein
VKDTLGPMVYRFGVFEFDDDTKELRKNGRPAALEPQPAKALALLLSRAAHRGGARADDIVSRDELRDAVWGQDTHVDFDRGLAYCVSQIRTALGDSGDNPRFIQTIPKKGFKLIAPVERVGTEAATPKTRARPESWRIGLALAGLVLFGIFALTRVFVDGSPAGTPVVIAVSVFDNETGNTDYDRQIAGLSDLVVERLTKLDPERIAVIGNAAILRQPRNTRNLKAVAANVKADYVLLGQLQKGETGLRFITHFIRLKDEAHLRANRLLIANPNLAGLEQSVVEEFERATREHVLNQPGN